MARLFVAIDLPAALRRELAALGHGVPGAKWVAVEQIHLTLRFIGEVDEQLVEMIKTGLATEPGLTAGTFTLRLSGVGVFPGRGLPRVLWVGVAANPPLLRLQGRIELVLTQLGLEPDRRRFSPHITLARLGNAPEAKVKKFLEEQARYESEPFPIGEFLLYSSLLTPKGAIHRIEANYPLEF